MRFWRRVKAAPGVTLNLSKSGTSVSLGPRGAKTMLGRGKLRQTVGLPGTGLFHTRRHPVALGVLIGVAIVAVIALVVELFLGILSAGASGGRSRRRRPLVMATRLPDRSSPCSDRE